MRRFSCRSLVVLTACAAVAGVFAATAKADVVLEGESMAPSTSDTTKIRVLADSAASGGSTLQFRNSPTHATASFTAAQQSDYMSLRMRGTQCEGAPQAVVSVDGLTVATFVVSSGSYQNYQFALLPDGNGSAGTHSLKVDYPNDFASSACNRALFLDKVEVRAVAASPFEAESMQRSTGNMTNIAVISDTAASSGMALTFRTSPTFGSRQYKTLFAAGEMTLRMRGTQCSGAPRATVSIDGVAPVTIDVSSNTYRDYAVQLAPTTTGSAGDTHSVKIEYTNDLANSSCNRNLFVDKITLVAHVTEPPPPEPNAGGRWLPKFAIPGVAIHMMMLRTGKVLYFSRLNEAHLLDPSSQTTERVDALINAYCAGQSFLPDGRVLVTGGHITDRHGLKSVLTFDPISKAWTRHDDMRSGRWYPSQVQLPDGRQLIMSGEDENDNPNLDIEIFDPTTNALSLLGVRGGAGAPPGGGWYPHLFVMPSGRLLVAGPDPRDSWFLTGGARPPLSWQDFSNIPEGRTFASGVLLPGGVNGSTRVMLIGGGRTAMKTSVIFDEANPSAGWVAGPSLNVGRSHHNTVILPDGSMVTVGGGYGNVDGVLRIGDPATHRSVELYDPQTNTWTLGPEQDELRTYHSTAVLLPDGRVISAGDDGYGGKISDTAQIYEPPYLFRGPRPTITAVPNSVAYGTTFTILSPDTDVTRAVLMAPGADTHATEMNQRYVPLTITRAADGTSLDAAAPPNANIAPPGYYMLFLLNADGVPSAAKFVRIG